MRSVVVVAAGLVILVLALIAQSMLGGVAGWVALVASMSLAAVVFVLLVRRAPSGVSSNTATAMHQRGWSRVALLTFIGLVAVLTGALILQAVFDSHVAGWV